MTRRCSHCSNNGHNSRTCPTRGGGGTGGATSNAAISGGSNGGGVRLFGVRLTDGSFMKKSASMGNLSHYQLNSSSSNTASPNNSNNNNINNNNNNNNNINTKHNNIPNSISSDNLHGYLSDDPNHASCSSNRRSERKKGKPWTEEEHRLFLVGLKKLGKGDWRGIARNYVVSRTPTQVASHAQKYYIRQSNATRRKRRSSLFDMVTDMVPEEPETVPEEQLFPPPPEPRETDNTTSQPSLNLSLSTEAEPMEATSAEEFKENDEAQPQPQSQALPSNMIPAFSTVFLPLSYPSFWPQGPQPRIHPDEDNKCESSQHQVLKPTPVLRKEPVNVDELVGLHKLNLSEAQNSHIIPPQLSLNLLGAPSRQSAFHASAPVSSSDLSEGTKNAIQAV